MKDYCVLPSCGALLFAIIIVLFALIALYTLLFAVSPNIVIVRKNAFNTLFLYKILQFWKRMDSFRDGFMRGFYPSKTMEQVFSPNVSPFSPLPSFPHPIPFSRGSMDSPLMSCKCMRWTLAYFEAIVTGVLRQFAPFCKWSSGSGGWWTAYMLLR